MKKHIISSILTLAMLISITGCSSDTSSIVSDAAQTTASTSQSETTEQTTSTTPAVTNDEKSGFDFDEAVKNITLFGKQISLPCTWEDMGSDFSSDELPVPVGDTGDLIVGLLYKGDRIGTIVMEDCEIGDNFAGKKIINLNIGINGRTYPFDDFDKAYLDSINTYSGLMELVFAGLSFESTEDDFREMLGEPTEVYSEYHSNELFYEYDTGYVDINFELGRVNKIVINHE